MAEHHNQEFKAEETLEFPYRSRMAQLSHLQESRIQVKQEMETYHLQESTLGIKRFRK